MKRPGASLLVFVCLPVALAASAAVLWMLDWNTPAQEQTAAPEPPPKQPPPKAKSPGDERGSDADKQVQRGLREGSAAPDFTLARVDNGQPLRLADLYRTKPVVLIFGSFTCNVFCGQAGYLDELYREYKGRAEFVFVVGRQAGHTMPGLEFVTEQTGGVEGKRARAVQALKVLGLTVPTVLDTDEAATEKAYLTWPSRLYVIDTTGRIALDAGPGVLWWDLQEVRKCLNSEIRAR